jgi:diphthamide biosynthesis methyltransferase
MLCVGVARIGQRTEKIVSGPMKELRRVDFGPPLHSLIICGDLHPLEREYLTIFHIKQTDYLTINNDNHQINDDNDNSTN